MHSMKPLTIAVSSRALFHIEDGNTIFETEGQEAFDSYMRRKEAEPLRPGTAFPLVKKLLALNDGQQGRNKRVEVVLLSRNSALAGMRIMNSVHHYGLDIERAVFTSGTDRFRYAKALGAHLFLSAHAGDVLKALEYGVPAATIQPIDAGTDVSDDATVRIAFDGDAVLFDNEADNAFQLGGLDHFRTSELQKAAVPLNAGPLKRLLEGLTTLQADLGDSRRLRIALITARGLPSHARPINTLLHWGLHVDEYVFAAGLEKGPLLQAFGADFFFDDVVKNVDSALSHSIQAGHVPYGKGAGIEVAPASQA